MIHQCYFEESQRQRLFTSPLYRGFGLYAEVNPDIARNCPELLDPSHVRQMSEYVAMLHLWRNPELDPDPWIGFTSYRQLDKTPVVFEDRQTIERHLAEADIIGWGWYDCFDVLNNQPLSLAEQAERCHLGINGALWRLLMLHNDLVPENYLMGTKGLFGNYWIMSKENFTEYMEWSAPLVAYALANPDSFAQQTPRALAFLVERLFICWYGIKKKRAIQLGRIERMGALNRLYRAHLKSHSSEPPVNGLVLPEWYATLDELCLRHRVRPKGIIHVGAHYAEERVIYQRLGVANVLWIEADPQHLPQLRANLAAFPGQRALQACLTDKDGELTTFYRTNNHGESSSVLPLGTHRALFPTIHVAGETHLQTTTFRTLAEREGIKAADYDMLVIDVQGAELLVLKGFDQLLKNFLGIYLEVNRGQVYVGCAQVEELDSYLRGFGFTRREMLLNKRDQGDALYLREGSYQPSPADLAKRREDTLWHLMDVRSFELEDKGKEPFVVELLQKGKLVSAGSQPRWWHVRDAGHDVVLEFTGPVGRTAFLLHEGNDVWRGRWVIGPDDEIVLRPRVSNRPKSEGPVAGGLA